MASAEPAAIPPLRVGTLKLFRLLLRVHALSLLATIRSLRQQSRLLLFVLGGFVVTYLGVGYWLFHSGLRYLQNFPLVGTLLSQRILFLIFGFFFVMLVFSNLIIGYSTLFKNRETNWLLTLPISHRDVYHWKFTESLVVSSWALIFLSAPMMAAYGRLHDAPLLFYLQVIAAYLPFVVIPGLLGSWGIVGLVRIVARPWLKKLVIIIGAVTVLALILAVKPISETEAASRQDVLSFDQLLRHTRLSLNPYLPSVWLAKSVLAWVEGLNRQGGFFFLVLLSNALLGIVIGSECVGRLYYGSWTSAASARAERFQRKAAAKREKKRRTPVIEWLLHRLPFLSQPMKALALKDARTFWRDPAQWTQFMIFFGLLCIYVVNLRNVAFDFRNDFWETIISYLNLAASGLTLSTLTTRFVFPQFSLEGRRLWIIGLAPIGLRKVLLQKFWLSCLVSMFITVSLMIASSQMLNLKLERTLFFTGAIALMSATLSGLAAGLGALFPNLKEDNPSKIVSGFGGTLCLVVSFIYIASFIALLMVPALRRVTRLEFFLADGMAVALAGLMSAIVLLVPMCLASHRLKNLEF